MTLYIISSFFSYPADEMKRGNYRNRSNYRNRGNL